MSYLVLARKWRPRRFAELVGQEHVVRALTNALDSGRVHHAFLFTGTRGVGKTTIARIFAKSPELRARPGAEPCGECGACVDIDAGRFVDLLEIDAASNTGVDDVRDADRERAVHAGARPLQGLPDRRSAHAVEERVQRAAEDAGGAAARTSSSCSRRPIRRKLPVTVLSRCLQFNLKRLTPEQISGQMRAHPRMPKASRSRRGASRCWRAPPTVAARRPVAARPGDRLRRRQRCAARDGARDARHGRARPGRRAARRARRRRWRAR